MYVCIVYVDYINHFAILKHVTLFRATFNFVSYFEAIQCFNNLNVLEVHPQLTLRIT